MHQADAEYAAFGLDAEPLRETQRIKITVPSEDAAMAEERSDLRRIVVADAERNGGTALMEALWIADAEDSDAGDAAQAFEQASEQRTLVGYSGAIRGQ